MPERTISDKILDSLYLAAQFVPRPFETKYAFVRRLKNLDPDKAYRSLNHLRERGLVKIARKNGKIFITLTAKGQLEVLLDKTNLDRSGLWDGKWRIIIFDIPEEAKDKRRFFRYLLKKHNFYKLQASVYISPYAFNREALLYLKQSGLMPYIRILRVDDMDDDSDLRKHFKFTK